MQRGQKYYYEYHDLGSKPHKAHESLDSGITFTSNLIKTMHSHHIEELHVEWETSYRLSS